MLTVAKLDADLVALVHVKLNVRVIVKEHV